METEDSISKVGNGDTGAPLYTEESVRRLKADQGEVLFTSLALDWTSLLAEVRSKPATVGYWKPPDSDDLSLVVVRSGDITFEEKEGKRVRRFGMRPGDARLLSCATLEEVRWFSNTSRTLQTVHLFVPRETVLLASEEYRRIGSRYAPVACWKRWLHDPVITAVSEAIMGALANGARNIYAESATLFLVKHLLSTQNPEYSIAEDRRTARLSDQRLRRVLDFVHAYYMKPLNLDDLAREAGISKFHFVGVFRKQVGVTPHRYLADMRLDEAAKLLETTTLTIEQIARSCGYKSTANFSTAFAQRFGKRPSLCPNRQGHPE